MPLDYDDWLNLRTFAQTAPLEEVKAALSEFWGELKFRKKRSLQDSVGESLLQFAGQYEDLELHEKQDLQAKDIATLYSKTISSISPRIVVQGGPRYLQVERTVNWIRTLLFSGLRSAVLWDQLGGSRWSLMFGRKQMASEAENLLRG